MREGDLADVMRGDLEAPGLSSCLAIREPPARLGRFEGADLLGRTKSAFDSMAGTWGRTCPLEPDTCTPPAWHVSHQHWCSCSHLGHL